MTVALLAVACAGKDYTVAEKPVLTADMYSVKAETKTGKVVFAFLKNDLSPFWSVTDPSGIRETFNQREVTRTFKSNGVYKGTLIAYGQAGQCNPVSFEFTIDTPIPEDSEVVKAKKALSGKTFKVGRYGWWGDGWEYFGGARIYGRRQDYLCGRRYPGDRPGRDGAHLQRRCLRR